MRLRITLIISFSEYQGRNLVAKAQLIKRLRKGKYWFDEGDLVEPIDWNFVGSLPEKVRLGLELYMEGRVSVGRAAEVSGLSLREFDEIRAKARVPVHTPSKIEV